MKWFTKLFRKSFQVPRPATRRRHSVLLQVENLEERALLSTGPVIFPIGPTWTSLGPAPIQNGQTPGSEPVSGRISALAASPSDANTIYIGAAGGGVWKTTNAGASWNPLTDNQATLFMGAIAIAPNNPNIIYAGTGEGNRSLDSYYGRGVLKSTDAGATWALMGQSSFDRNTISRIVVDGFNADIVYVATAGGGSNGANGLGGIWKSTDGGDTWQLKTAEFISTSAPFTDFVMGSRPPLAKSPAILYAAVGNSSYGGVYVSTDAGGHWSPAGDFPMGANDGRITLALVSSAKLFEPDTLYASIVDPSTNQLAKMMKSTDGGAHWTQLTNTPSYLGNGWYATTLAVNPSNPNLVFAAGDDQIIMSSDGGANWSYIGFGADGNGPHPDHHAMGFDASGRLLDGNDGGIWRLDNSTAGSIKWTDLNTNLAITQFYGIALDPTNADIAYGGSQDNGNEKFDQSPAWNLIGGGDGGLVRVDPSNPNIVYATFNGTLERSDNAGASWTPKVSGIDPAEIGGRIFIPFALDPTLSTFPGPTTGKIVARRLLLGTNRVYESTNNGDSWSPLSTPGQNGWTLASTTDPTAPQILSVAVAATDRNTIYATAGGYVFVTTNHGASWRTTRPAVGTPDFTDLIVDPTDANTAYVVAANFSNVTGGGQVWRTTDAGATWTNISSNLPDVPTWSIAFVPQMTAAGPLPYHADGLIFVGTDNGVYVSANLGASWSRFGQGLPNAQVRDLELNTRLNILAAGTHGRGMWEIDLASVYTVTNTNDSGKGSLRDAITQVNTDGHVLQDTINFDIPILFALPINPIPTIRPTSPLPTITASVVIDATTQPFLNRVELDGANALPLSGSLPVNGLVITGGTSKVRGMVINGFTGNDIELSGQGGDVLEGNFLGTDKSGTAVVGDTLVGNGVRYEVLIDNVANNTIGGTTDAARNIITGNDVAGINISGSGATGNVVEGNFIGTDLTGMRKPVYRIPPPGMPAADQGIGIVVTGSNNLIGGTVAGARNIISGNGNWGLSVGGNGNLVQGNYIGTDVAGTASVANGIVGVLAGAASGGSPNIVGGTAPGAGNVISGNTGDGISLGSNTLVEGNFIGLDFTGEAALQNDGAGVDIEGGSNNVIGGTVPGARNVISSNHLVGVLIADTSSGNHVSGNYLGTDSNGLSAFPDRRSFAGVYLQNSASGNTIGTYLDNQGNLAGSGNVISGNLYGVYVTDSASQNQVQGNFIGTDYLGTGLIGNATGVYIVNAPGFGNTLIGGTTPDSPNVIAGNGVGIQIDVGNDNGIHQNSIHDNAVHGIVLSGDSNNSQTAPTLSSAVSGTNSVTVTFKVTTTTAGTYTIEFFANDASDPDEGKTYLGTDTLGNLNGNSTVSRTFKINNVMVLPGQFITATATAKGTANIPHDNTSQFSKGQVLSGPGGLIATETPTFVWAEVPGAAHYTIWVTDLTTGQSPVLLIPNATGISLTLTTAQALTPGHSYRWWVSGDGGITWSSTTNFTIVPLGVPSASGPSGTTATDLPTFSWTAGTGTTPAFYEIWLKDVSSTAQAQYIRASSAATTSTAPHSLISGDNYEWAIAPVSTNGHWGSFSNVLSFTAGVPTPTSPADGTTVTTELPTFSWTAADGAAAYDIWLKDTTPGTPGLILSAGTGSPYTLPASKPLTPGHSYYWAVGAVSGPGQVAWNNSGILTFTVAGPTPIGPGSTLTTDLPAFSWAPGAEAGTQDSYEIWLKDVTSNAPAQYLAANSGATSLTPARSLVPGDNYEWAIRTVSPSGQRGTFSNMLSFTAGAPSPISPAGGNTLTTDMPTLSWTTVAGAMSYTIWLKDTMPPVPAAPLLTVTGSSYLLTLTQGLTPGHSYQWTVGATTASGQFGWSQNVATFTVAPLQAPIPLTPHTTGTSATPTFSWTAGAGTVPGSYDLWLGDGTVDPKNPQLVTYLKNLTETSYTYTAPANKPLISGHTYQWYVAAVSSNNGTTMWTATGVSFTVT